MQITTKHLPPLPDWKQTDRAWLYFVRIYLATVTNLFMSPLPLAPFPHYRTRPSLFVLLWMIGAYFYCCWWWCWLLLLPAALCSTLYPNMLLSLCVWVHVLQFDVQNVSRFIMSVCVWALQVLWSVKWNTVTKSALTQRRRHLHGRFSCSVATQTKSNWNRNKNEQTVTICILLLPSSGNRKLKMIHFCFLFRIQS